MPATASIAPGRHEWLALSDGVGHSQPVSGRERAACGEARIDPRFAHPIRTRCPKCIDRVGIVVSRPQPEPVESESEQRFAWGDR